MRIAAALVLLGLVVGCDGGGHGSDLAVPADLGSADLAGGVADLAGGGVDLAGADLGRNCNPDCPACTSGVCCGGGCCNAGEWCDHGTCRCGDPPNAACAQGMMCASNIARPNGCGFLCCGNGVACPP